MPVRQNSLVARNEMKAAAYNRGLAARLAGRWNHQHFIIIEQWFRLDEQSQAFGC